MVRIELGRARRSTGVGHIWRTARSSDIVRAVVNPVADQNANRDRYWFN